MKRFFLFLFLVACDSSSSSGAAPTPSVSAVPSAVATPSAAPSASASAAPVVKGNAPAPSALSFCKSTYASEPLSAICAVGQNYDKSHFDCAQPLPVNFCADLVEWGCQYVGPNEKAPKTMFEARFVRGGVAPTGGEIISDDQLRARYPRGGVVRGVIVNQSVSGKDEGQKLAAAQIKKLVSAGCAAQTNGSALDCGGWQADVRYVEGSQQVVVHADSPTTPDCTKQL
jgi:hypothetical protein